MGIAGWSAWACVVLAASLGTLMRRPPTPRDSPAGTAARRSRDRRPWSVWRPGRIRAGFSARTAASARRRRSRPENDVGAVLVAVAARLRAGMAPADAWERSLRAATPGVAEALGAALATTGTDGPARAAGATGPAAFIETVRRDGRAAWRPSGPTRSPAVHTAVDSAIVARDVARRLGAELADVLDACAAGIEEAGRAAADRTSALGGPRATARVLSWLPLGGLVLGTAVGADPLGWLLGSWWGLFVTALAAAFTLAGRLWIRALVATAERAGT